MDLRRLSRGEWIAAAGALLLLVALFLPWYSAGDESATAWQTMAVNDVIYAFAALLALAAVAVASLKSLSGFSVAALSLASLVSVLTLLLVIVRLVSPAPEVDVGLELGAWLGLLGAAGLAYGCLTGVADEGPVRRSEAAERAATQEALARAELLSLPPDVGSAAAGPGAGRAQRG